MLPEAGVGPLEKGGTTLSPRDRLQAFSIRELDLFNVN